MGQAAPAKKRMTEFDWLKVSALILLLLVHSNLYKTYPEIFNPMTWVALSAFFFVAGFLTFDSLNKRGSSIKSFLKSKLLSLYIPFAIAGTFYFLFEIAVGVVSSARIATGDPIRLLTRLTMLNIFDKVNTGIYNWVFLWFIPYLLVFMLTFCLLEKHVKNTKHQALIVITIWILAILAWTYNIPTKLGRDFSQYLLIFTTGFWLNKSKTYEKLISFNAAYTVVPLSALLSIGLSGFFSSNSANETFMSLLLTDLRNLILSICLVLLILILLRKLKAPRNIYIELIAASSIFIYLAEPFVTFMFNMYIFKTQIVYISSGIAFYIYLLLRIAILLVLLPLTIRAMKNHIPKKK